MDNNNSYIMLLPSDVLSYLFAIACNSRYEDRHDGNYLTFLALLFTCKRFKQIAHNGKFKIYCDINLLWYSKFTKKFIRLNKSFLSDFPKNENKLPPHIHGRLVLPQSKFVNLQITYKFVLDLALPLASLRSRINFDLSLTDEGVKHMQLHIFNAYKNSSLTDEEIKH